MLRKSKVVIIDGYNVLRNSERYAHFVGQAPIFEDWTSEVWNAAREALLNDVLQTLDKNSQAIIIYDAAKRDAASAECGQAQTSPPLFGNKNGALNITKNCQVIFTNPGESADARIQKLVYAARQKRLEVQVVTSDLGIQDATMNKGVVRISSREFVTAITEETAEATAIIKQGSASASLLDSKQFLGTISKKATGNNSSNLTPKQANAPMRAKIEDTVDPETAAKLRHLRDSL